MATKPISTAKVYLVTSQEPCSATLTQGESVITWEALAEGGQTTVIVPAGATLELSAPAALLSPLPFEAALAVGNGNSGGRASHSPVGITLTQAEGKTPVVKLAHEAWYELNAQTQRCTLIPAGATISQAHLLLTPAAPMPSGWLTADGAIVRWPFGEIAMPTGWSYIITLVQVGNVILANALPVDLSTPA